MTLASLKQFDCPSIHETVSAIIRRRSTNKTDVRLAALDGLDLTAATNILDLGCGFGFMSEVLARRAAPEACVLGVDLWQANEAPFRKRIAATGRRADFKCMSIDSALPLADRVFDFIASSYSLYFFVDVLAEVARVLRPDGVFLAVTHTEDGFQDILRVTGRTQVGSGLRTLARTFSAENGSSLLRRWFGEVDRIDYDNALRFERDHLEELLTYLRFKLPFFESNGAPGAELPEDQSRYAAAELAQAGHVIVRKDDAVFRCRRPLCH